MQTRNAVLIPAFHAQQQNVCVCVVCVVTVTVQFSVENGFWRTRFILCVNFYCIVWGRRIRAIHIHHNGGAMAIGRQQTHTNTHARLHSSAFLAAVAAAAPSARLIRHTHTPVPVYYI